MRSVDGEFSTGTLVELVDALRLPRPSNPSAVLARLRDAAPSLIRRGRQRGWMLTPEGARQAVELVGDFDSALIAVELASASEALFAHGAYPTLPPMLAPISWAAGIKSFLEVWPFERNVFLMTRFPRVGEADPLRSTIEALREALADRGLHLHLASDQQIVDDLWGNVGAHMWSCRFGVGLLETPNGYGAGRQTSEAESDPESPHNETLNDNVLIELGSMLTIGRRCLILRDPKAPMPPTDLTSQIFKTVELSDHGAVREAAVAWVAKDLRLTD